MNLTGCARPCPPLRAVPPVVVVAFVAFVIPVASDVVARLAVVAPDECPSDALVAANSPPSFPLVSRVVVALGAGAFASVDGGVSVSIVASARACATPDAASLSPSPVGAS